MKHGKLLFRFDIICGSDELRRQNIIYHMESHVKIYKYTMKNFECTFNIIIYRCTLILWTESLNSGFFHIQPMSTKWTTSPILTNKKYMKIQVMAWDRHNYVVEINRLMGSRSSSLGNWIYCTSFTMLRLLQSEL
jgi:hypothetical protein